MAKASTKLSKPAATPSVPDAPDLGEQWENTEEAGEPAEVLMSAGGFDITIEDVGDLPADTFKAARRGGNALPFKGWFDKLVGFSTWHEVFLPDAFWMDRGSKPDPKFARSKLNRAFDDWKKVDKEKRDKVEMKLVGRKQGDTNAQGKPYPSGGVSIFVRNPSAT